MAFLNSVFQRADTFIQRIGEVVAPVEGPAQELQIAIRKHDWPTTQRLLQENFFGGDAPVSYTHLRAHETVLDLVCRLLLEKKKK